MHCACQHIRYHSDSWFHNDCCRLWEAGRQTNIFFLLPKRLHLPPHCKLNLVVCLTIFNRLRAATWRGSSRRSLVSLLPVMQPRPDGHKGSPSPDGHKKQNRLSSPSPLCINHWPPPASQPCPLPTNNIWFMALHMCQGNITVPYWTGTNPSTHLTSSSFVCLSFPVVCLCTDGSYEMTKEAEQKCKRATGAAFSQGIQMIRLLSAAEWVRPDLGLLTCTGPQYIS